MGEELLSLHVLVAEGLGFLFRDDMSTPLRSGPNWGLVAGSVSACAWTMEEARLQSLLLVPLLQALTEEFRACFIVATWEPEPVEL